MAEQDMTGRDELQARVIARAGEDPRFRAALVADARQAIGAEFGVTLPEGLEIVVVEETANKKYLVLPAAKELSDADLVSSTEMGYVGKVSGFIAHRS